MTVPILSREEQNGKVPRLSLNEQAVLGVLLLGPAAAPDLARLFAPGGPVSYTHLTLPTNREV